MKISNKINLSFFVVASLIAITASFSFYSMARDSLQKLIRDNLAISVAARSRQVDTYLDSIALVAQQAAKNPTFENALKPVAAVKNKKKQPANPLPKIASDNLAAIKSSEAAIFDILLANEGGKVIAASSENKTGQDKSGESYFNLGKKGVYVSDIYLSAEYGAPIMTVTAPIVSTSSKLAGVLITHYDLSRLNRIMTDASGLGKSGEIYLVNQFGYIVSPSRFVPDVVLKQLIDSANYKRSLARAGRETVMPEGIYSDAFPNYRGAEVLGDNDYIQRMSWSVLAEMEAEEAYAPLTKLQLILLMILLLAPLAAWLLGEAISRTISGPLHRLYQGVQIINSGNLDYRLNNKAKDEVGELSRAFDDLAQNLKKLTGTKRRIKAQPESKTSAKKGKK